ncbi:oligosaccharide flippase family protein, partial [bacterium]|nr:oligosaccharide flippase family protein [bacterium]
MKQKINKIIDKAEKFFKTDLRYLLKNGFWQTIGQIIAMIASLITMRAFAYWIPKETFGAYQYVLSIISILAIFTLPGMQNALMRAIAKGKEGTLKDCMKEKAKWSLIGIFGCLVISAWYFIHHNTVLGKSFLVASLLFPISRISNIAFSFWQGRKDFQAHSKYFIIINFLEALFFIPVLFLTNNLTLIILTYFLSRAFFRFLFLKKTLQKIKNNEEDKEAITLGKHLTFMQIIGLITSQLDKIIIWQFLGPVQVAIYSFAQIPVTKINAIINPAALLLPKLSQKNIEKIKKELFNKFLKSFLF